MDGYAVKSLGGPYERAADSDPRSGLLSPSISYTEWACIV